MHFYRRIVLILIQDKNTEVAFVGGLSTCVMYNIRWGFILHSLKLICISTLKIVQFTKYTNTAGHL